MLLLSPVNLSLIGGPTSDTLALFLVQVFLILVIVRILGRGLARLKQPIVIGEIIAGILLGTSTHTQQYRTHSQSQTNQKNGDVSSYCDFRLLTDPKPYFRRIPTPEAPDPLQWILSKSEIHIQERQRMTTNGK